MVKFVEVDPRDIEDGQFSHRGRVSYPILKGFMETKTFMVMIDRTGMQQSASGLQSSLGAYAKKHQLPIRVFSRNSQVYLMRLDVDSQGKEVPNWKDTYEPDTSNASPIGVIEVERRYKEEKDKTTK